MGTKAAKHPRATRRHLRYKRPLILRAPRPWLDREDVEKVKPCSGGRDLKGEA